MHVINHKNSTLHTAIKYTFTLIYTPQRSSNIALHGPRTLKWELFFFFVIEKYRYVYLYIENINSCNTEHTDVLHLQHTMHNNAQKGHTGTDLYSTMKSQVYEWWIAKVLCCVLSSPTSVLHSDSGELRTLLESNIVALSWCSAKMVQSSQYLDWKGVQLLDLYLFKVQGLGNLPRR